MVAVDGRILVVGVHRWVGDELLTTWVERLDPGAAAWNAVGQVPGRLGHQLVARPDGKVLVIGGIDATYTPTTSTFVLDPLVGTALAGPSLLQHRAWARAVSAAGMPLVIGGTASCSSQECLLSETLAGPTWQIAGFTSAPREDHTATVLQDGTVLVVGSNFAFAMGSAERYAPSLGWHAASPPNVGCAGHAATLLSDGRVLIAGGYTSTACEVTASSEIFTP